MTPLESTCKRLRAPTKALCEYYRRVSESRRVSPLKLTAIWRQHQAQGQEPGRRDSSDLAKNTVQPAVGLSRLRSSFMMLLVSLAACATAETPGLSTTDGGGTDAGRAAQPDAALPIEVELSQGSSDEIVVGTLACTSQNPQTNRENSYYRVFDLTALGISDPFTVSKVTLGIEEATSGAGGSQPIEVKLHTLDGTFVRANLTEIANAPVQVPDQQLTLLDVNIAATVPGNSLLVAEVFIPTAQNVANHLFFLGSNKAGESASSYIRAPASGCDFTEPIPLPTLTTAGSEVHIVLKVTGTH